MKLWRTSEIENLLKELETEAIPGKSTLGDKWIDHRVAVNLGRVHKIPLSKLLHGTQIYLDPVPPPSPKPEEYLKFMAQLRQDEEERQYQLLINNGHTNNNPSDSPSIKSISNEVSEQLTTIFNVLVSIVAVGWAFWYWCASWPLGSRTLMSLFAGVLTGIAEIVVYSGYLRRSRESKERLKKTRGESRRVVKEIVFHKGKESERTVESQPPDEEKKYTPIEKKGKSEADTNYARGGGKLRLRETT